MERLDSKWGNQLKNCGDPIDEKMRESHLRWFGHIQIKSELIQIEGMKKIWGRPKITLTEVVKNGHLN